MSVKDGIEKIENALLSICYCVQETPDCQEYFVCRGCGARAWLVKDIKHAPKCSVEEVRKGMVWVRAKLELAEIGAELVGLGKELKEEIRKEHKK